MNQAIDLLSKLGYPVEGEQNPLLKKAKSTIDEILTTCYYRSIKNRI